MAGFHILPNALDRGLCGATSQQRIKPESAPPPPNVAFMITHAVIYSNIVIVTRFLSNPGVRTV